MAEIKFKATVKSAYDRFLIVYEKHSKKNAQDQWETTGYTDFKVWLPEGMSGADFKEKDWIEVQGKQKTEVSEKDGKSYKNLVVNASVIETLKGGKATVPNTWAEVDAPF
jgi:hypothetical protein